MQDVGAGELSDESCDLIKVFVTVSAIDSGSDEACSDSCPRLWQAFAERGGEAEFGAPRPFGVDRSFAARGSCPVGTFAASGAASADFFVNVSRPGRGGRPGLLR